MPIFEIVFYTFSLIMLGAAVAVISVRNPVYAALFLVLAFFSASAIWMLLEVEFLAIILILVYVGAVMVLFLFVVMMLDINVAPVKEGFIKYLPAALTVAGLSLVVALVVGMPAAIGPVRRVEDRGRKGQSGLDDDGGKAVRQDGDEHQPSDPRPGHTSGGDVVLLPFGQHAGTGQADIVGLQNDGDGDHRVGQGRAEDRHQNDEGKT